MSKSKKKSQPVKAKRKARIKPVKAWYGSSEVSHLIALDFARMLLDRMMAHNVSPDELAKISGVPAEVVVRTTLAHNLDLDTNTIARLGAPLGLFTVMIERPNTPRRSAS